MKKKKFVKTVMSFVFAAFLVAMALPAFAAEGDAVKFVEYHNEEFGLSFSYPDFFKPEYNVRRHVNRPGTHGRLLVVADYMRHTAAAQEKSLSESLTELEQSLRELGDLFR